MKKCQKCGRNFDIPGARCPVCQGTLRPVGEQKKTGQKANAVPRQSAQNPYAKPVKNPFDPYGKPARNPYAKPQVNPYGKPASNPYAKPQANPYAKPASNPYAKPQANPYAKPALPQNASGEQPAASVSAIEQSREPTFNSLPPAAGEGTGAQTQHMPPVAQKKGGKGKKVFLAVTACVAALALIFTGIFSLFGRKPYMLQAGDGSTDNAMELQEGVQVIDSSAAAKSLKDITYDDETGEYTLSYKALPEEMQQLQSGAMFIVPPDPDSKTMQFNLGFSGQVSEAGSDYVRFSIPDFNQIFKNMKVNTASLGLSNVMFVPEQGVSVQQEQAVQTAAIGSVNAKTEKVSFGSFSLDTSYAKPDKQSQLEGYDIIAKNLSLEFKKKAKTADDNDIEVSGKIAFDYPAVKLNLDFEENDIKDYDVGFIAEQTLKLKVKGSKEVNFLEPDLGLIDYSIIDIKDTYDEEAGKVVLGSYMVGAYVPLLENKHKIPVLGIGFVFQICLTASGKITIECETSQSGFLQVETNSKKEGTCLYKNTKYPNPVLGETAQEGEDYDTIEMKSRAKGTLEFTAALSGDVGFAILGMVPLKLANDIPRFKLTTAFSKEEEQPAKFDVAENLTMKRAENISYYALSLNSTMRFNIGAEFKLLGIKVEVGQIYMEYKVWSYVLMQYPQPVPFTVKECGFGGIALGQAYTNEDMDTAFYESLKKTDHYSLSGKVKDTFIQAAVNTIVNKFGGLLSEGDLISELELNGDYDLVCYSEGAIYFLDGNVVKAQLIMGEGIINRSFVSCTSSNSFFQQVYSEPTQQAKTKISIGELGKELLKETELSGLTQYDGMDLEVYEYKNEKDNANMEIVFDGSGKPIFIFTYLG